MSLIFVDVEADFNSPCPGIAGGMTEFGAVEFVTKRTFHGFPYECVIDRLNEFAFDPRDASMWYETMIEFERWVKEFTGPSVFVSDNPAYDWQWINYHFHHTIKRNPFGHSARRIGDFYAGLVEDFKASSRWKKLRVTPHTHDPVDDAMGNVEAFERMLKGER